MVKLNEFMRSDEPFNIVKLCRAMNVDIPYGAFIIRECLQYGAIKCVEKQTYIAVSEYWQKYEELSDRAAVLVTEDDRYIPLKVRRCSVCGSSMYYDNIGFFCLRCNHEEKEA